MKQFSTDNRFFDCMGNIGDWIILNILFVFTSLPVITIGMSLTAMYQVTLRRSRGEGIYVVRDYLQACRTEWRQSTKLWLIFLFSGSVLLFDVLYSKNLWSLLNVAIGCLSAIWCFVFCYAFPLQARIENNIKNTLRNALLLAVKNLPYTLIMVLLNSIPAVCIAAGVFAVQMAAPVYCAIGFSLTARINSIFLSRIFRAFDKEEKHADLSRL